jgi:hypothetical protein
MRNLTYDGVEQAMKDAVPEVQDKYPELLRWHTDPPGLYTLFSQVLKAGGAEIDGLCGSHIEAEK